MKEDNASPLALAIVFKSPRGNRFGDFLNCTPIADDTVVAAVNVSFVAA